MVWLYSQAHLTRNMEWANVVSFTSKHLKHPNINFIGVERYAAPLYLGVKKIKRLSAHKLPNLKLLLINAYELRYYLSPL